MREEYVRAREVLVEFHHERRRPDQGERRRKELL